MATVTGTPLISTEEYIARFVEGGEKPMCEYIDGELRPKPIPTRKHSQAQANIMRYIVLNNEERFEALPELTTRLRKSKFYAPDIAVEDIAHPIEGRYLVTKILSFCVSKSSHRAIALGSCSASARNIIRGAFGIAGSLTPSVKLPGSILLMTRNLAKPMQR